MTDLPDLIIQATGPDKQYREYWLELAEEKEWAHLHMAAQKWIDQDQEWVSLYHEKLRHRQERLKLLHEIQAEATRAIRARS